MYFQCSASIDMIESRLPRRKSGIRISCKWRFNSASPITWLKRSINLTSTAYQRGRSGVLVGSKEGLLGFQALGSG